MFLSGLFWYASIFLTCVSIILILVLVPIFGTKINQVVGNFIFKFWKFIALLIPIYLYVIIDLIHRIPSSSSEDEALNKIETLKIQGKLYITAIGIVGYIGVIVLSWQISIWSKRNQQVRAQIADHNSERPHAD